MFLYPTGRKYIIDHLNQTFKASLRPEEFNWIGPRALDEDEQKLFPDATVSVQLRSNNDAKVYGNVDLYYHRLDIGTLIGKDSVNDFEMPISPVTVDTSHECLAAFNQFFGIELTKDDVVDLPVDRLNQTVEIRVKDNCLLWTGSATMRIKAGDSIMGDLLENDTVASVFDYPNFNTNNGQAPLYAYGFNFTETMRPYQNRGTDISTVELMTILASTTRDPWTIFRSPSHWNLFESTVVYNGANTDEFPTDPFYDSVLVVELAYYCTNFAGRLYLHYNRS